MTPAPRLPTSEPIEVTQFPAHSPPPPNLATTASYHYVWAHHGPAALQALEPCSREAGWLRCTSAESSSSDFGAAVAPDPVIDRSATSNSTSFLMSGSPRDGLGTSPSRRKPIDGSSEVSSDGTETGQ